MNDIRKRAGCDEVNTVSAADALKLIKRERRIELMGEGVRWFDLVRWGNGKRKFKVYLIVIIIRMVPIRIM